MLLHCLLFLNRYLSPNKKILLATSNYTDKSFPFQKLSGLLDIQVSTEEGNTQPTILTENSRIKSEFLGKTFRSITIGPYYSSSAVLHSFPTENSPHIKVSSVRTYPSLFTTMITNVCALAP